MTKTLKEFDYIFTSSGKLMILYVSINAAADQAAFCVSTSTSCALIMS